MVNETLQIISDSQIEQKEKFRASLKVFLDLINSKIVEIPNGKTGVLEKRVVEPFESRIDKKSITVEDLKKIANLPIEILLSHDEDGELIASTGRPSSTQHDYGDEHKERIEKAKDIELERVIDASKKDLKTSGLYAAMFETNEDVLYLRRFEQVEDLNRKRMQNIQSYTVHNHPSGTSEISLGDAGAFSRSGSENNIVLSKVDISITPKSGIGISERITKFILENVSDFEVLKQKTKEFIKSLNLTKETLENKDENLARIVEMMKK
jgi:hypothetical protein